MTPNCINQSTSTAQLAAGFIFFTIFFTVLYFCQQSQMKSQASKQKQTLYQQIQINMQNKKHQKHQSSKSEPLQKFQQPQKDTEVLKNIGESSVVRMSKIGGGGDVKLKLAQFAYKYVEKEAEMLGVYRSKEEIEKERDLYLRRKKGNGDNQKNKEKEKTNMKRADSFAKLPKKETKPAEKKPNDDDFDLFQTKNNNIAPEETGPKKKRNSMQSKLFGELAGQPKETDKKKPETIPTPPSPLFNPILNVNNPTTNPTVKIPSTSPTTPPWQNSRLFPELSKQKKTDPQVNPLPTQVGPKNINPAPSAPSTPPVPVAVETKKQQPKKESLFPPLKEEQKKKEQKKQDMKQPSRPKEQMKVVSAQDYLEAIIKYSDKIAIQAEISTSISNLDGAKSNPKEFWEFASAYIKTINPGRPEEVSTFTYRVWQAIVHKFIKNANSKDGFEKITPKQKGEQVQKNAINTYALLINIFRVLGHEAIWLGIFGKTLKMMSFLFNRKEPIKNWRKLELLDCKYLQVNGDIGSKYHSRLDFLSYFLLILTSFDPILFFSEVSGKTGEVYPFLDELKKSKHKWSYREFWCLIEAVKSNKTECYFKIPFWNNVLSATYPQLLTHLQNKGEKKEFMALSKWIFKEVKELTKNIDKAGEGEILFSQEEDDEGQGVQFEFDGEEFIGGIKTLGRSLESKEREMKTTVWQEFRDKFSVFYYFWRII